MLSFFDYPFRLADYTSSLYSSALVRSVRVHFATVCFSKVRLSKVRLATTRLDQFDAKENMCAALEIACDGKAPSVFYKLFNIAQHSVACTSTYLRAVRLLRMLQEHWHSEPGRLSIWPRVPDQPAIMWRFKPRIPDLRPESHRYICFLQISEFPNSFEKKFQQKMKLNLLHVLLSTFNLLRFSLGSSSNL